jgi:hypothetical protein
VSIDQGSLFPSAVTGKIGFFDRFAGKASDIVSRAPFFAFCLLLVLTWLVEGAFRVVSDGPSAFLGDSYQLQITPRRRSSRSCSSRSCRTARPGATAPCTTS